MSSLNQDRNSSYSESIDSRASGKLSQEQVQMIEEALESVGDFGEVHLVVEKGRLRFLVVQKSVDALRWEQNASGGR